MRPILTGCRQIGKPLLWVIVSAGVVLPQRIETAGRRGAEGDLGWPVPVSTPQPAHLTLYYGTGFMLPPSKPECRSCLSP